MVNACQRMPMAGEEAVLQRVISKLEAFSVDDGWTCFVVFLFGDPHSLEGGEGGQDGTTNPDGVFSFWWGDDLDFHGGWSQSSDFFAFDRQYLGTWWYHRRGRCW